MLYATEKTAILNQLSRSYQKLLEALEMPASQPLTIDGTIRRFERTYEIACETIHTFYENYHLARRPYNKCLHEALKNGWINDQECWASLMESKSHASFVFSEQLAKDVYETVKKSHHVFGALIASCKTLANH